MEKIEVMLVLHAYQPPYPIQERFVVDRIIKNCYKPIVSNLEKYENVKLVINMNASLTEMLLEAAPDIIQTLSERAETGQVEFLESGAYHPILPLISLQHAKIQIEINHKINSEAFGPSYQPKGMWPPELAVDSNTIQLFAEMGYSYSIIPENSIPKHDNNKVPYTKHETRDFILINRDKNLSNSISFNAYNGSVIDAVNQFGKVYSDQGLPIVIATDMETFGEHNPEYWNFLFEFLTNENIESVLSDKLLNSHQKVQISEINSSSWSTEDIEVEKEIAFPLWDHPLNPIHSIQHAHLSIVEQMFERVKNLEELTEEELSMYLKSAQSCQFWWADRNNGRWSPDIINKGLDFQRKAILSQNNDLSAQLSDNLIKRLKKLLNSNP